VGKGSNYTKVTDSALKVADRILSSCVYVSVGDVNFSEIVGCDLDILRHGGAYGRLKDGVDGSGCGRQKRLRTSFKHHQLRSMKAYFALNHNPDAKDLKELAQKTGLTKRVLQVSYNTRRHVARYILRTVCQTKLTSKVVQTQ